MDTVINYLALSGFKESVTKVEQEYHREQAKQSEKARLSVIAQDIFWTYQVDHRNWEKYSRELNARIEDAHRSQASQVRFSMLRCMIERCSVFYSLSISISEERNN